MIPSHEEFPGGQTVLGLLSSGPSLISSTLDNFSAGLKVHFHEYFRIYFHPLGISKLNCIKLLSHCFSLIFTHSMARVMLNMIFKVHCELWWRRAQFIEGHTFPSTEKTCPGIKLFPLVDLGNTDRKSEAVAPRNL